MVETVKDTVATKIEIVDLPEETTENRGLRFWLIVSALLIVAAAVFMIARRLTSDEEDKD